MTTKQRMVADLKSKLLAPAPLKKKLSKSNTILDEPVTEEPD